jgi:ATP-dependent helicase IRC3
MLTLRPYQDQCIAAVLAATKERRLRRQLVLLPTGTGKTIIFASIIRIIRGRVIVLVHRDELVQQSEDKIRLVIPDADIGIVKARRNQINARIVIASVQTISQDHRLRQLTKDFALTVVDEAHHAAAPTYKKVLAALSSKLTIGFTATADRGDGQGLDDIFQDIVYTKDILEMITAGYLVDIKAKQLRLDVNFNKLHTRNGDFVESELEEMLLDANILVHGPAAYREHAADRKALAFVPTVKLAHDLADAFNKAGIVSAAIDAGTPLEQRRALLVRYARGEIRVLTNCMVLTEGYDDPSTDCIIMARPTKSRPLYTQMIGRGTRLHPGKQNLLVLDFVGSTTRHDLITAATLFGAHPEEDETIGEAVAREQAERDYQGQPNEGRLVAEAIDIFKNARYRWLDPGTGVYMLSTTTGMLILNPDMNGWTVTYIAPGCAPQSLASNMKLEYAQGIAEDFARAQGVPGILNPHVPVGLPAPLP